MDRIALKFWLSPLWTAMLAELLPPHRPAIGWAAASASPSSSPPYSPWSGLGPSGRTLPTHRPPTRRATSTRPPCDRVAPGSMVPAGQRGHAPARSGLADSGRGRSAPVRRSDGRVGVDTMGGHGRSLGAGAQRGRCRAAAASALASLVRVDHQGRVIAESTVDIARSGSGLDAAGAVAGAETASDPAQARNASTSRPGSRRQRGQQSQQSVLLPIAGRSLGIPPTPRRW
jgi:hypothetical protein